jgi:hypothetical protein
MGVQLIRRILLGILAFFIGIKHASALGKGY